MLLRCYLKQQKKSSGMVKLLLDARVEYDIPQSDDGKTPLFWAAMKGNNEIIKVLFETGANVNSLDKYSKRPIHYATILGPLEFVKQLIEYGADISVKDIYERTPLHCAIQIGNTEL